MSQEMYSALLLARGGEKYSWENRVSEYTIEDVDMEAFKSYLAKAKAVGESNLNPTTLLWFWKNWIFFQKMVYIF